MRRDLLSSLVAALAFSLAILLILGISEQTGNLWFGGYFFIFAVVAYGLTDLVDGSGGPTGLPIILAWLILLPAMVVFYWPLALLGLRLRRFLGDSHRRPAASAATRAGKF